MGFCWNALVGWDWRPANEGSSIKDTLYVYTAGCIIRIYGEQATKVYAEIMARKLKNTL
jgi:hypothetical protein